MWEDRCGSVQNNGMRGEGKCFKLKKLEGARMKEN